MKPDADKPAKVIKCYPLKAVIWRNEQDGKHPWYSVDFFRTYKDGNGDYQQARTVSGEQLLQLSHLAAKAYDALAKLEAADHEEVAKAA